MCARNPHGHNMRVVGEDPDGRPVVYTCFAQANERWDTTNNIADLTHLLETTIARTMDAGRGVEKMLWIIDFHGFAMRDAFQPATTLQTARLLDHYPERLHRIIMVDAPRLFDATFRAVSLILPAETAAKVKFVRRGRGSAGDATRAYLRDALGPGFAAWLEVEMDENRDPERYASRLTPAMVPKKPGYAAKRYWEWLEEVPATDGDGGRDGGGGGNSGGGDDTATTTIVKRKAHDPRAYPPFVASERYQNRVREKFLEGQRALALRLAQQEQSASQQADTAAAAAESDDVASTLDVALHVAGAGVCGGVGDADEVFLDAMG